VSNHQQRQVQERRKHALVASCARRENGEQPVVAREGGLVVPAVNADWRTSRDARLVLRRLADGEYRVRESCELPLPRWEGLRDVYLTWTLSEVRMHHVVQRHGLAGAGEQANPVSVARANRTVSQIVRRTGSDLVASSCGRSPVVWGALLAGGDGSRLQELTAKVEGDRRPKQFCRILGDETLLSQTRRRISPIGDRAPPASHRGRRNLPRPLGLPSFFAEAPVLRYKIAMSKGWSDITTARPSPPCPRYRVVRHTLVVCSARRNWVLY
jgi:hypothetical protein